MGSSRPASTTSQFKNYMRPCGKRIEKEREEKGMDKNKKERDREEIKEEQGKTRKKGKLGKGMSRKPPLVLRFLSVGQSNMM